MSRDETPMREDNYAKFLVDNNTTIEEAIGMMIAYKSEYTYIGKVVANMYALLNKTNDGSVSHAEQMKAIEMSIQSKRENMF